MKTNPFLQIALCILVIFSLVIISFRIPNFIVIFLNNSFCISLICGIILFALNTFYFYNNEFEKNSEYEKMVMDVFSKCIIRPFTLTAGFYTSLIILKLNVCDYQYISGSYTMYDRSFMIGAMILLLIYIVGKAVLIIKEQLDFWHLDILSYRGVNINDDANQKKNSGLWHPSLTLQPLRSSDNRAYPATPLRGSAQIGSLRSPTSDTLGTLAKILLRTCIFTNTKSNS